MFARISKLHILKSLILFSRLQYKHKLGLKKKLSKSDKGILSSWSMDGPGFTISLDTTGKAFVGVGSSNLSERVTSNHLLRNGVQYFIAGRYNNRTRQLFLAVHSSPSWPLQASSMTVKRHLSTAFNIHCCGALLIGARSKLRAPTERHPLLVILTEA